MANGIVTPLQLSAAAQLLNNQGIAGLPSTLTSALTTINATTVIANFLAAVSFYVTQSYATAGTLQQLLKIGESTVPALGDSIPVAYTNLVPVTTSPYGFTGLIQQTGDNYLGNGDAGKFARGFMATDGYISTVNQYINSSVNVQTYFGPTFTSMDALVTNSISDINANFGGFAADLFQQGLLWNPADMSLYGTPVGLLQQLANVAGLNTGFFGGLQSALLNQGLTAADIETLLAGPGDLTTTDFNRLQQLAYQAMTNVTGDTLAQVLAILDVSLPNINSMADLLDATKTYPRSYTTLQFPDGFTWKPVYLGPDSVNLDAAPVVNIVLPTASGCDELAKVIPPGQAVANKAIQIGLQQITGLPLTTLPQLAQAVQGIADRTWDPTKMYQTDDLVSYGTDTIINYRAQQNVPTGIDINDTSYWQPTSLGGLNTMAGLSLIESQTTPVASSVTSYFANSQATGTGPNGTITVCDVLGTAIDYNDFATRLTTATTNIDSLQSAGALTALNTAYTTILVAANDAAVLAQIANANAAIASIASNPSYTAQVTALNTAWDYIAGYLNKEKTYQDQGGIDYTLLSQEQTSVMAFVQQLPQYGLDTDSCGACEFITSIADTTVLGGQAMIGVMREGQNIARLGRAQVTQNYRPSPDPAVTPSPAVTPVY